MRVTGNASQAAGATGHGGLLVIDGDAGHRCGISMKGIDIVVKGSIGHFGAFMAQAGNLVVLRRRRARTSAIRSTRRKLYVRGKVESLGADCVEKEMTAEDRTELAALLKRAGVDADAGRLPALRLGPQALPLQRRPRRRVLTMAAAHSPRPLPPEPSMTVDPRNLQGLGHLPAGR